MKFKINRLEKFNTIYRNLIFDCKKLSNTVNYRFKSHTELNKILLSETLKKSSYFHLFNILSFLSCLLTTELRSFSWTELKTNISSGNLWWWLSKIVMNFWSLNKNKQNKYWDVSLWIAELEILVKFR